MDCYDSKGCIGECDNCKVNPDNTEDNVLHVYGQDKQHDDVAIVGDKKALENLKNMIDRALNGEMVVLDDDADCFFTNDGEGFNVRIWCENNTKELTLPYKK